MNQAEAMEHFGVRSRATWAKLVKQGMPRAPMGRGFSYDSDEIKTWMETNNVVLGTRGGDTTGGQFTDVQERYETERALKTAAERELRELKLAEERGELVRATEVNAEWSRAALKIRTSVMNIAAQALPGVLAADTPIETEEAIRTVCRRALEDLAS